MKKILAVTIMMFLFSSGFSQRIHYGVGAGLNYSKMVFNSSVDDVKYKLGFQINPILEYQLNDKIGFRMELGYVNRGFAFNSSDSSKTTINVNYMSLPLLVKYSPIKKFSILLGPELAYRLSANSIKNGKKVDLKSSFDSKIDLGINLGLSYVLADKFEVGLRYNRGFIPTSKDVTMYDESGRKLGKFKDWNQGLAFSIAYMIK